MRITPSPRWFSHSLRMLGSPQRCDGNVWAGAISDGRSKHLNRAGSFLLCFASQRPSLHPPLGIQSTFSMATRNLSLPRRHLSPLPPLPKLISLKVLLPWLVHSLQLIRRMIAMPRTILLLLRPTRLVAKFVHSPERTVSIRMRCMLTTRSPTPRRFRTHSQMSLLSPTSTTKTKYQARFWLLSMPLSGR